MYQETVRNIQGPGYYWLSVFESRTACQTRVQIALTMKKKYSSGMRTIHFCLIAIISASCTPVPGSIPAENQSTSVAFPTNTPVLIAKATQTSTPVSPLPGVPVILTPPQSIAEFTEPDPETYVMVLPAVLEYFHYRKKAILSGNPEDVWEHYPELKIETDIPNGINMEGFVITNYQGLKLFDGNISPEHYEQIHVKTMNDNIQVLVHGMELYLFLDENGDFNESGGEFKIVLYLYRKGGRWVVFRTDEVTQSEWEEFGT